MPLTTTARPPCTAPRTRTFRAPCKFLADKGAKIDIWNTRNEFGWTPLTIARGYRFGNFKPSAVTVAAVEQVMLAARRDSADRERGKRKGFDIYAPENQQRRQATGDSHASYARCTTVPDLTRTRFWRYRMATFPRVFALALAVLALLSVSVLNVTCPGDDRHVLWRRSG